MRFKIPYQSEEEVKNYIEKLSFDQLKEMIEFKGSYSEITQKFLMQEYWARIQKEIKPIDD